MIFKFKSHAYLDIIIYRLLLIAIALLIIRIFIFKKISTKIRIILYRLRNSIDKRKTA